MCNKSCLNNDYQKGYQEGYEQCKKDFASNPLSIFELLPDLQANAQKLMQKHKEDISEEHRALLEKALKGEITQGELLKFVKEQNDK